VQLRMKDASSDEIIATGRPLARLCRDFGATFIIDDHVALVGELGADGVHLGKNDMPVAQARKILGSDRIIGATANTLDDMLAAVEAGADYIGLGPFRFTTTKEKLSPVLGLDGYRRIMSEFRRSSDLPVVAIGGITAEDLEDIMTTGVTGVAVSGALLSADNPAATTRHFLAKIGLTTPNS
ncbi:MAG: thiamine phosphate synthase, partial [Muribaculaceae bacterium]|nr:thiamine phosphate synthase [Muribaculaceae bacterium]